MVIYRVQGKALCGRYILSLSLLAGALVGEEETTRMNLEVAGFIPSCGYRVLEQSTSESRQTGLTVTWPSVLDTPSGSVQSDVIHLNQLIQSSIQSSQPDAQYIVIERSQKTQIERF